jgi:hypothetical protein
MEDVQEFPGVNPCRLAGCTRVGMILWCLSPGVRAGTKTDFPENQYLPQGLFRVIIGGRDTGDAQKGREMFFLQAVRKFLSACAGLNWSGVCRSCRVPG